MDLRKLAKNRGSFPSDEALTKLFFLLHLKLGYLSPKQYEKNWY